MKNNYEKIDFSWVNLLNEDTIGADLSGASLCDADLSGTSFSHNADLDGVDTYHKELLTKAALAYFGFAIECK